MAMMKLDTHIGTVVDPYTGAQKALANLTAQRQQQFANALAMKADARQVKKDALAQQQQDFTNGIATQANARQQWAAQAKGMGQGQLVTDAMKDVTSKTNGLDNTNAMEAANKLFLNAGTNPKMEELVSRLDNSAVYNEAMKGILGNNELTPELATAKEEAVKQGVLGKDYGLYKKLTDTAGSNVEALNKEAKDKDYSDLYKTTDANAVKSALVDQLIKGGVNPVYADKVATEKAGQYLMTAPKWTETDKQKVAMWDKELTSLNKNTTSDTTTTGTDKSKKNKKTHYSSTAPKTQSVMTAIGSVAKFAGIDNSWLNGENELKNAYEYASIGAQPIKVKNGKGVETTVYASPDEAAAALLPLTKTNYVAGNQFGSVNAFKTQLQKQVQADYEQNNYGSGSGGAHGSKTASSTEKRVTKAAQQRIDQITKLKTALINSHRNPTGQDVVDRLFGTKNGKRSDVVDLNSLYSKPTDGTKTHGKKPQMNALLAALNSPKKGEVANVLANNTDAGKLNTMLDALSGKDRSRFETVANRDGDLIGKLLGAKYPELSGDSTKREVGTEVPGIFGGIKIAGAGTTVMGIPNTGSNGAVSSKNSSTPNNSAELDMQLRKKANERAVEMGDFPIEYKDSQGVTRMSDSPSQALDDVSLEITPAKVLPLALKLRAPAARVVATMRDLIGKGFTKTKAEYLIRTGQVKLLPRAPQQINVPLGGFSKANLRYNIGIPAMMK